MTDTPFSPHNAAIGTSSLIDKIESPSSLPLEESFKVFFLSLFLTSMLCHAKGKASKQANMRSTRGIPSFLPSSFPSSSSSSYFHSSPWPGWLAGYSRSYVFAREGRKKEREKMPGGPSTSDFSSAIHILKLHTSNSIYLSVCPSVRPSSVLPDFFHSPMRTSYRGRVNERI